MVGKDVVDSVKVRETKDECRRTGQRAPAYFKSVPTTASLS